MKDPLGKFKDRLTAKLEVQTTTQMVYGAWSFLHSCLTLQMLLWNMQAFLEWASMVRNHKGPLVQGIVESTAVQTMQARYLVLSLIPSLLQGVYGVFLFLQTDDFGMIKGRFFTPASFLASLWYIGLFVFRLVVCMLDTNRSVDYRLFEFYHDYVLQYGPAFTFAVINLAYLQLKLDIVRKLLESRKLSSHNLGSSSDVQKSLEKATTEKLKAE